MSSTTRAILFKLGAVLMSVAMFALIKIGRDEVPPGQAVFFRAVFALPLIVAWLAVTKELRTGLRMVNPMGHVWRSVVGTAGMGLSFAAIAYLPLGEAQAIQYTAPLLVVIFAAMFLGEQVRMFRLGAVVLGLIGVLIVLAPNLSSIQNGGLEAGQSFGAVLMVMSAVFVALAQVFIRKLVATEHTAAIVFWFSIFSALMGLLTLPFGWVVPSPSVTLMLIVAGFCGGFGQILMTTSFRLAPMSVVAPFDYASMLVALTVGYFVFDEIPTLTMLLGVLLIVAAGILIIWREHALGIERAKARRALSSQG